MERFTPVEKAEFVVAFNWVPHGQKPAWLRERGIGSRSMAAWRKAYQ